jgi:hypothetical protein
LRAPFTEVRLAFHFLTSLLLSEHRSHQPPRCDEPGSVPIRDSHVLSLHFERRS